MSEHKASIRRAERIGYIASAVAVILTIVMTGTNQAIEANPVSRWIIGHGGWMAWAILTPLALAVMYRVARFTSEGFSILGHEVDGDPRASLATSWLFSSALFADAFGNLVYTSAVGFPTVNWITFAPPVIAVSTLSLYFAFRWEFQSIATRLAEHTPKRFLHRTVSAILSISIILSAMSGLMIVDQSASPIGTASAASAVIEDFEDGSVGTWAGSITTDSAEGTYAVTYDVTCSANRCEAGGGSFGQTYNKPESLSVYHKFDSLPAGDYNQAPGFLWHNSSSSEPVIDISVPNGNVLANNGNNKVDTGIDISAGNYYRFIAKNIDYNDRTYTLVVENAGGNEIGSASGLPLSDAYSWDTSVDGMRYMTTSGFSGNITTDYLTVDQFVTYTVSGTVTDSDGNAIDGATVSTGTGKSATTSSDGSYSLNLQNGTYDITASASGYANVTDTVEVSGSAVSKNFTLAGNLRGTVVDQNGDPVSNATVIGYAAKYPSVSESRDKLTNFSNPLPPGWIDQGKANVDLLGNSGFFSNKSSYVAAHGQNSLQNTAPWIDGADLSTSKLKHPANKPIILSAWDGTASGFGVNTCIPAPGGNEYDCQMPGEHKPDTTIVVERLDGSGDVVMRSELQTDETAGSGFGDPDQFHYTTAELQPGFYRFYEKGSGNKGLVHMVGDPTALIQQSAEDVEGQLTTQAKNVDDALNAGDLQRVTTPTDSDGSFSLSVSSNSKMVTIQAIKAPDVLNTTPSNLDVQTITSEYNTALTATDPTETQRTLLNSSVYFPSRTQVVEPPKSDVTIRMTELSSPPGANATALQDQLERLRERLQNQSFSDLKGSLQEQLENVNRDRLEKLHEELDTIREQNDQLEQRYEELLEKQLDTENPNLDVNLNDTSDAELRSRIQALQQTITELQSTVESGPGEVTSSTDTVTYRQRFGSPLENPEQVSVIADWSNGTSQVVSDEYISVNNDPENIAGFGGSEIVVEDFPIDSSDPKAVSFRVVGATEDGFAKTTKQVKNPTFSGELPSLQSISVNSLEPASNETVNLKVNPGEGSIQEISDVTVYGPNGQQTGAPSVDGRTATFTTDAGTGVYSVRVTLTTADGVSTTETLRLPVANTDKPRKPSIRAKESPIGAYAIVGDGISNGDVKVENGGSSVTVLAQLKDESDVPSRLHVYTESLSLSSDADTTVRVVRGQNQESISRHVRLTIHSQSVPDDALIWRNDQPIPIDSESQYGTATTTGRGLSIQTYTDGSGAVTVRTQTNPSLIDEAQFWVASNVNLNDLNPLMTSPAAATVPGSRTGRTAIAS